MTYINDKKTDSTQNSLPTIYAQTHAEFLNKVFGTNYQRWMKSVWKYHNYIDVWMVRFYDCRDDWENRFINGEEIIHEVYLGSSPSTYDRSSNARIAVAIEDRGTYRQYSIKGLYRFVPNESNARLHVYHRIPDETARKLVPKIYNI